MPDAKPIFTPAELQEWQQRIAQANRHNVLCYCRQCDSEWVGSGPTPCQNCGSKDIEFLLCWQFPDG